jgi:hypothetical protein
MYAPFPPELILLDRRCGVDLMNCLAIGCRLKKRSSKEQ